MVRITNEIARSFIAKLAELGFQNVNIISLDGTILASHDLSRLGYLHIGSLEVMQHQHEDVFYPDHELPEGTRPGVTTPILFHGKCVGAVGVTGHPEEVRQSAQIIRLTIESLLEQQDLHRKLEYKRKLMENWVLELVEGDAQTLKEMESSQELLGIDPQSLCCVAVLTLRDSDGAPLQYGDYLQHEDAILNAMQSRKVNFHGFLGQGRMLCALEVNGHEDMAAILAACESLQRWTQELPLRAAIGIGLPERGLVGFQGSYRQALHSMTLIEKLNYPKKIMSIQDWGIIALIDQAPAAAKRSFSHQFLDGKQPLSDVQWQTLETYFTHNQNLGETAEALFVHKNTLLYRLRVILETLGLNPHQFQDAVILQILVYFKSLLIE